MAYTSEVRFKGLVRRAGSVYVITIPAYSSPSTKLNVIYVPTTRQSWIS